MRNVPIVMRRSRARTILLRRACVLKVRLRWRASLYSSKQLEGNAQHSLRTIASAVVPGTGPLPIWLVVGYGFVTDGFASFRAVPKYLPSACTPSYLDQPPTITLEAITPNGVHFG
jgi:hypothetical protein